MRTFLARQDERVESSPRSTGRRSTCPADAASRARARRGRSDGTVVGGRQGLVLRRAAGRRHARSCCCARASSARRPGARTSKGCCSRAALGVRARGRDRRFLLARRIARPVRRVADASAAARGRRGARRPCRRRAPRELASLARVVQRHGRASSSTRRDAERAFLLSVSHELKTPLTAVLGYAEGLADGAVDVEDGGRDDRHGGRAARAARARPARSRADEPPRVQRAQRAVDLARGREPSAAGAPRGAGRVFGIELVARRGRRRLARGDARPRAPGALEPRRERAARLRRRRLRPRSSSRPGLLAVEDDGPRPDARRDRRARSSASSSTRATAASGAVGRGSASRSSTSSRARWAGASSAERPGSLTRFSLRLPVLVGDPAALPDAFSPAP